MAGHSDTIQCILDQTDLIVGLLDRASAEPSVLADLTADPFGTAAAAGIRITPSDLKALLGLSGATDQELVEVIRQRIVAAHPASCGCGG
jgi:hypothetical protein